MKFFCIMMHLTLLVGFADAAEDAVLPAKAEAAQSESPKQLSVEPLTADYFREVTYPSDRPEWVSQTPELEGKVHHWPVFSIPCDSAEAAEENMFLQAREAVRRYLKSELGSDDSQLISQLDLSKPWIEAHLIDPAKVYQGTVETPEGLRYEHAAELVFAPDTRTELARNLRQIQVSRTLDERIRAVIGLALLSFLGLASVSTLLRLVAAKQR